jgi:hypothetical protein
MERETSFGISDEPADIRPRIQSNMAPHCFAVSVFFPSRILKPLFLCMFQENCGLVVPWIIGFITFMALEAVAMVYSNVLRDHVNRVRALCNIRPSVVLSQTS